MANKKRTTTHKKKKRKQGQRFDFEKFIDAVREKKGKLTYRKAARPAKGFKVDHVKLHRMLASHHEAESRIELDTILEFCTWMVRNIGDFIIMPRIREKKK